MAIQLSKPIINKEERNNVLKVLDSGLLARGKYVDEFESSFAKYIGSRYAISTSNGTTALHAALLAAGIKPGDSVITTPFSFIATSNAIIHCGARIIFADIDPATFNISPYEMEEVLGRHKGKIKAALITHLYGLPCMMDDIIKLVKKYRLILAEDCAQAHGAEFRGKKVGSFGNIAIFSFYGSKNMTTGEGGMITTSSKTLYERCKRSIDQGRESKFIYSEAGFNYRMSNLAAAIGVAQLKKIEELNRARIKNALYLSANLEGISWLVTPQWPRYARHVFHQYAIRIRENRDGFIGYLKKKGIAAAPNYPLPIHKQPAYKKLGYGRCNLPQAEKAAREVVNIPVHSGLKKTDLNKIVEVIRSWKG